MVSVLNATRFEARFDYGFTVMVTPDPAEWPPVIAVMLNVICCAVPWEWLSVKVPTGSGPFTPQTASGSPLHSGIFVFAGSEGLAVTVDEVLFMVIVPSKGHVPASPW
jgi:hypothetical protein